MQCQGQEYKNHEIVMRKLNFGKAIIETAPIFKTLFRVLHYNFFFRLLLNYVIIVRYKGEYIQVSGQALNEKYNMKALGGPVRKPLLRKDTGMRN